MLVCSVSSSRTPVRTERWISPSYQRRVLQARADRVGIQHGDPDRAHSCRSIDTSGHQVHQSVHRSLGPASSVRVASAPSPPTRVHGPLHQSPPRLQQICDGVCSLSQPPAAWRQSRRSGSRVLNWRPQRWDGMTSSIAAEESSSPCMSVVHRRVDSTMRGEAAANRQPTAASNCIDRTAHKSKSSDGDRLDVRMRTGGLLT
jgi:hypothetical protein